MIPRFLWDFLNPRRWFRARNTAIALPAPPLPPSPPIDFHPRMEEQESPEPEPIAPSRDSSSSSYKSAKADISPSQSEANTPRRSVDSDVEEMPTEENEPKLHELSDQDSSSDDEEELELHAKTQVTTPPNLHGPSNFRRTSLVMKKRKLTESSDEESQSQKRIKKATKVTRPSPSQSIISNESVEIVGEVIREPTRKNRRMSMLMREKVDNESDTPISTRKRLSIKKEKFSPAVEVARVKSLKENDTPSTSKVSSGRKQKEKETPSTSVAKKSVDILRKEKTFATPSSSKSVKKSRMERDDSPSSVASMNVRASTPMNRPQRACRAMTVSPTRFLRDSVTPARSISKVNTGKKGRGRPLKKSPLVAAEI